MAENEKIPEGRTYERGTLILTEKPFAFVLDGKLHKERCDFCFARSSLLKCSACSHAHYCNSECQKKGWVFHKEECPNIKKFAPRQASETVRLHARIIMKLKRYGLKSQLMDSKNKSRSFYDLMTHEMEIANDPSKLETFVKLKMLLQEYMGNDLLPDDCELLRIFGRVVINSFAICDEDFKRIGVGLYIAGSVFDHSCDPNAVYAFYGTTLTIRTIKVLQSIKFSDIYISYIEGLDSPEMRQKKLNEIYYFLCQCEKCSDLQELKDMTSIICPNERCGSAIPGGLDDLAPKCPNCKLEVPSAKLEEIKEVVTFTEENLSKMQDIAYLDVCRVCLSKHEHLLHPMNIYNVKVLLNAFESCVSLEKWEDAFNYGTKLEPYMRKYLGKWSVKFGIFLMTMGKVAFIVNKFEEERKLKYEAADILVTLVGRRHPLVSNEVLPELPD